MCLCVPCCNCGCQRTTYRSWFLSFNCVGPENQTQLLRLGSNALNCWAILLAQPSFFMSLEIFPNPYRSELYLLQALLSSAMRPLPLGALLRVNCPCCPWPLALSPEASRSRFPGICADPASTGPSPWFTSPEYLPTSLWSFPSSPSLYAPPSMVMFSVLSFTLRLSFYARVLGDWLYCQRS